MVCGEVAAACAVTEGVLLPSQCRPPACGTELTDVLSDPGKWPTPSVSLVWALRDFEPFWKTDQQLIDREASGPGTHTHSETMPLQPALPHSVPPHPRASKGVHCGRPPALREKSELGTMRKQCPCFCWCIVLHGIF